LLFSKNRNNTNEEKSNFWVSYADIMAGLLLMFILILLVIVFDYKDVLQQKQSKIDQMLGIRTQIIESLQKEFENTNLKLEIDAQTGAIRFPGKVFFDYNSIWINNQGRNDLAVFIPRYIEILLGINFRPYISQIIVEGHTDNTGTYMYNLELSQSRALAVVKEIYKEGFPDFNEKELLKQFITANGRSFSQLIYNEDNTVNNSKSRRVEFKFRLKDDQMIKELKEVLER